MFQKYNSNNKYVENICKEQAKKCDEKIEICKFDKKVIAQLQSQRQQRQLQHLSTAPGLGSPRRYRGLSLLPRVADGVLADW